jgi:hypothetical protein
MPLTPPLRGYTVVFVYCLIAKGILTMYRTLRLPAALLVAALLILLTAPVALAHGHIEVGDYELVIGFRNEPAYQGEPNGLDLTVTHKPTGERVNDLAGTLKVEIVAGSAKRELEIRPQFGEDGAYTADVLPSEAGDYTWHIWGDIKGTPVEVSMISSPDTFSAVQAKSAVAFPAAEPTAAELQAQAVAAADSARLALIVGGVGALLGVVGIVVGLLGLRARRAAPAQSPRTA